MSAANVYYTCYQTATVTITASEHVRTYLTREFQLSALYFSSPGPFLQLKYIRAFYTPQKDDDDDDGSWSPHENFLEWQVHVTTARGRLNARIK